MKNFLAAFAIGTAALALAGCADAGDAAEENAAATADVDTGAEATTAPADETGDTGTAAATTPDATIVVEDNVRYQVQPDGTRVRIGPGGAEVSVDGEQLDAQIDSDGPSVEVKTN